MASAVDDTSDLKDATASVAEELGQISGPERLAAHLIMLDKRTTLNEQLIASLAEMLGVELKQRQVKGGWQFYWEKSGRVVVP